MSTNSLTFNDTKPFIRCQIALVRRLSGVSSYSRHPYWVSSPLFSSNQHPHPEQMAYLRWLSKQITQDEPRSPTVFSLTRNNSLKSLSSSSVPAHQRQIKSFAISSSAECSVHTVDQMTAIQNERKQLTMKWKWKNENTSSDPSFSDRTIHILNSFSSISLFRECSGVTGLSVHYERLHSLDACNIGK